MKFLQVGTARHDSYNFIVFNDKDTYHRGSSLEYTESWIPYISLVTDIYIEKKIITEFKLELLL